MTLAIMPSCRDHTMLINLGGQPSFDRMDQRPCLLTVSKASVRSMNKRYRYYRCSRHLSCSWRTANIMSTVPLFCLNRVIGCPASCGMLTGLDGASFVRATFSRPVPVWGERCCPWRGLLRHQGGNRAPPLPRYTEERPIRLGRLSAGLWLAALSAILRLPPLPLARRYRTLVDQ